MAKEFWLSLPVREIARSTAFFKKIGVKIGGGPGSTSSSVPLLLGDKNVVVMLFEEATFKGFVNQEVADTATTCEVLLSIGASSKEEVDQIAQLAIDAGGASNHKPYEMVGSMYGCIFSDLDGHKWNVLYMNM